ncbi:MAG: hypothetical protein CBC47_01195 [Alphaproteobacteria bacterium TMED87]|nr:SAM-dependent methyltransferase [Rhodospirillaceae bacterium]OUV11503.1 MAG: hypothetical protein CBC47_01195 [Alphaproteobacteria bacterium TMED87]
MTNKIPLPPPYSRIHRHKVLPKVNHDENSRMNFIANLNIHVGNVLFPGVSQVYKNKVEPSFIKKYGRKPETSVEVRNIIKENTIYQAWSAIRRNTMEMRHQIGRSIVFRQIHKLINQSNRLNETNPETLQLDENVKIPSYLRAIDNHCMPGSYYTEVMEKDISAPANYEAGHFTTVAGGTGPKSDIVGRAMAKWIKENNNGFHPKVIYDIGAGAGINTLPIAQAFPDSQIFAIDVAAPMLRYGHARAVDMGVKNVIFKQADFEFSEFKETTADLIISAMFFHEISAKSMRSILRKSLTMLKSGGLMLHMEQPNFDEDTEAFEKFVRDWDAWYNGEPYWAKLHSLNIVEEMLAAGFDKDKVFEASQHIDRHHKSYPSWSGQFSRHAHEAKMREDKIKSNPKNNGGIYMFGAYK